MTKKSLGYNANRLLLIANKSSTFHYWSLKAITHNGHKRKPIFFGKCIFSRNSSYEQHFTILTIIARCTAWNNIAHVCILKTRSKQFMQVLWELSERIKHCNSEDVNTKSQNLSLILSSAAFPCWQFQWKSVNAMVKPVFL